jgi:hypothetical protein
MGRGPPTRCGATSYFLIDPNRSFVNDRHRKLYLTGPNPSGDPAAERHNGQSDPELPGLTRS